MSDEKLRRLVRKARAEPTPENLAQLGVAYLRIAGDNPYPKWRLTFGWKGYGVYGQGDTPEKAVYHAFYEAAKHWSPEEEEGFLEAYDPTWEMFNPELGYYVGAERPPLDWDKIFSLEKMAEGVLSLKGLVLSLDYAFRNVGGGDENSLNLAIQTSNLLHEIETWHDDWWESELV